MFYYLPKEILEARSITQNVYSSRCKKQITFPGQKCCQDKGLEKRLTKCFVPFRPGLWHKARKMTLTAGQTDVKVMIDVDEDLFSCIFSISPLVAHFVASPLQTVWSQIRPDKTFENCMTLLWYFLKMFLKY